MPKGPKGEKRPSDVIGNAVKVMRIAVAEDADEAPPDDGKNKAAQELGRMGGKARTAKLSDSSTILASARCVCIALKKMLIRQIARSAAMALGETHCTPEPRDRFCCT